MKQQQTQSQSGVAMMMALITMLIVSVLAGELVYQTQVYSGLVFRARDQLRATLLARSGLRLALLQVRAAKKAKSKAKLLGLGDGTSLTDRIWQTTLVLPPPTPAGLSPVDNQNLEAFRKSLGLEGTLTVTILGQNDRVSLNQLVWAPSAASPNSPQTAEKSGAGGAAKGGDVVGTTGTPDPAQKTEQMRQLRQDFATTLQDLLEKKRQSDEGFRDRYPNLSGATLMENILAFIDPETKVDGDNRDKNDYYSRAQPAPYALKDAPFATESELFMVKGIDDTLAKLLTDNYTMQATSSFNVNKASRLLLAAMIPELSPDVLDRIEKRRTDDTLGGPFKDEADFWNFLATLGDYGDAKERLTKRGLKMLGEETSYRVVISAQSGAAAKVWVADLGPLPPKVEDPSQPKTNTQTNTSTSTSTSTGTNTSTDTGAENNDTDSLRIIYLKAD